LLEITVRSLAPLSRKAAISASGMPQRPKPPTANVCPSATTSRKASSALVLTLFLRLVAAVAAAMEWLRCGMPAF